MYVRALHIRVVHEAPHHRVPVPDVCRPGVRLLLDQRISHQADPVAHTSRQLSTPVRQHPRRHVKFKS